MSGARKGHHATLGFALSLLGAFGIFRVDMVLVFS
jgi:hypothetical protein